MRFFLILLAIPVIEIALFIQIGGLIGVLPTLGLVLLSALAGMALLQRGQGMTLGSVQAALQRGEDPGEKIFGGAMMLIAAGLLIIPGFLSDVIALLLLIPQVRSLIYAGVRRRMRLHATTIISGFGEPSANAGPRDHVIDGDFRDVTPDAHPDTLSDDKRPTHNPSGWTRH